MKKKQFKMTRRQVLKAGIVGGAGMMLPLSFYQRKHLQYPAAPGLSDPAVQPKFVENCTRTPWIPDFFYDTSKGQKQGYSLGADRSADWLMLKWY